MKIKKRPIFNILIILLVSSNLSAKVYKCIGKNGLIEYQEYKCATQTKTEIMNVKEQVKPVVIRNKRNTNAINKRINKSRIKAENKRREDQKNDRELSRKKESFRNKARRKKQAAINKKKNKPKDIYFIFLD